MRKGIVHRDLKPATSRSRPTGGSRSSTSAWPSWTASSTAIQELANATCRRRATGMDPRHRRLHGAGAGARQAGGQARRHLGLRRVLYEMLTGRRPFQGDTSSDTIAALLTTEPNWDRVPPAAQPLLRRCLTKDPKRRLHDAGDIDLLLDAAPAAAMATTGRSWVPWAVAASLLATLGPIAFRHYRERPPVGESIRFQIPQTLNLAASGNVGLSPDGRHLAFLAAGGDGRIRIFVRTMDSLEVRALEGSEVAVHAPPFIWSPDSRFIAFDAGGVLKKLNIAGGPAQTLCEISAPAIGGSWNRRGDIVLGNVTGGLFRVSENGGPITPVTALDPARKEDAHVLPTFLPDGRHFIYLRAARNSPNLSGTLYIGTLDVKPEDQSSERLLPYATGMTYAPPAGASGTLVVRGRRVPDCAAIRRRAARDCRRRRHRGRERRRLPRRRAFFGLVDQHPRLPDRLFEFRLPGSIARATWAVASRRPADLPALRCRRWRPACRGGVTNPRDSGIRFWLFDLVRGENPTRFTYFPAMRADFPLWSLDGKQVLFRFPGPAVSASSGKISSRARTRRRCWKARPG